MINKLRIPNDFSHCIHKIINLSVNLHGFWLLVRNCKFNNILVIIMAANFIYETRVSGDNHQSWLPVTEYLCHNPFLSSFTWFVTSEAQRLAVEVHELLTDFTPGVQWGFFDFLCSCCRPFTFVVFLRRVFYPKCGRQ